MISLISLEKNWYLIIDDFIKKSGQIYLNFIEKIIKYKKKNFI